VPSPIRTVASAVAARFVPVGVRGRNYLVGFGGDARWSIAHVNLYFDAVSRSRIFSHHVRSRLPDFVEPEFYKKKLSASHATVLQQATTSDFRSTMVDDYLVKVDRASMLASLEIRAPFLDHQLIGFAFQNVPDQLKAGKRGRKVLLRRLGQKLLPPDFNLTRKHGFSLPIGSWFRGPWQDYARSVLANASPFIFDKRAVMSLLTQHSVGMANSQRLFSLMMFELWRREYNVTIPWESGHQV